MRTTTGQPDLGVPLGDDVEWEAAVADVGLVVLTVIVFGLLVVLLRGTERL